MAPWVVVEVWRGTEDVPSGWGRCVATIGVFDGVHRGHLQILEEALAAARAVALPCLVLTFDPHPAEVVRPGSHPAILTSTGRKAELLAELGVDVMCVQAFTPEFSRLSADAFVHEVLVDRLHVAAVVVGRNFRYGHRAAGDVDRLAVAGAASGFAVTAVDLVMRGDVTLSSTFARSCVAAGDVGTAAAVLGRPHRVEGVVVRGERRGRSLGFPTANVESARYTAVPGDGVYACLVQHSGAVHQAAVSVGTNPSFDGTGRTVEAYLLDFDGDLYGERVSVDFVARLRPMERFADPSDLIAQMAQDVVDARAELPRGSRTRSR